MSLLSRSIRLFVAGSVALALAVVAGRVSAIPTPFTVNVGDVIAGIFRFDGAVFYRVYTPGGQVKGDLYTPDQVAATGCAVSLRSGDLYGTNFVDSFMRFPSQPGGTLEQDMGPPPVTLTPTGFDAPESVAIFADGRVGIGHANSVINLGTASVAVW